MGKGTSIGHQNKHGLNQLLGRELRSASAENMSEDLSNIDDAEILPYLNKEKEIQIKKVLWEILNKKYSKSRQPKGARNLKKATPAEKAVKVSVEKENKKRASSKINYDVLNKLLGDEHEEIPGMGESSKDGAYGGSASETPQTTFGTTEERDGYEFGDRHNEESDAGDDFNNDLSYDYEEDGEDINGEDYS